MDINLLIERLKDASCPMHGKISEFNIIDGNLSMQTCCHDFAETCQTIYTEYGIEEAQKAILRGFNNGSGNTGD